MTVEHEYNGKANIGKDRKIHTIVVKPNNSRLVTVRQTTKEFGLIISGECTFLIVTQ
jgi:hypothetical protein